MHFWIHAVILPLVQLLLAFVGGVIGGYGFERSRHMQTDENGQNGDYRFRVLDADGNPVSDDALSAEGGDRLIRDVKDGRYR